MDKPILNVNDKESTLAAIAQLGVDDLRFLNSAIVDQLKALRNASDAQNIAQFAVGDRVTFTDKAGERLSATVLKLNKKTVGLVTDDDVRWKVSPQLLELIEPPANNNVIDFAQSEPDTDTDTDKDRQQSLSLSLADGQEWIGGFVASPGYVTGEGDPYQPILVAWMNAEQLVVGMAVSRPDDLEKDLVASLHKAISKPMAGTPVTPDRIRIADPALISHLHNAFPGIEFIQAPTPELDEIGNSMRESMGVGSNPAPTYLESGAEPAAVGEMFRAAAELYRAAPWETIPHDQCLIGVSIPALGIENAALSIVGRMLQHFGFLFFSTLIDYERYLTTTDRMRREMPTDTPVYTALTFESGADLNPAIRKEISENGWQVENANAYPELFTPDKNQLVRPIVPRDITLVQLLCSSLPELLDTVGDAYTAWLPTSKIVDYPVAVSLHDELVTVKFTIPFPYQEALQANRTSSPLIAKLVAHGRASGDVDLDALQPLHAELQNGFRLSPEYDALDNDRIDISSLICEFAATYLNNTIATLQSSDLEEILYDIVPRKVAYDASDAKACIEEARAFYHYLNREHGLFQASECLDVLTNTAVQELSEALSDEDNFGMGKSLLTAASKLGYDTETQEGLNAFMSAVNQGDIPGFADQFFPAMPYPEPSLPPNKPVDKKSRKNKRKNARKARKKNR